MEANMSDNESHGWWQVVLGVWREHIADHSLLLTCTCGQQLIVMGEGKEAVIDMFMAQIPSKGQLPGVGLDENASCPECGQLLFTPQKVSRHELHLEAIDVDEEQLDRFLAELDRRARARWRWRPTLDN